MEGEGRFGEYKLGINVMMVDLEMSTSSGLLMPLWVGVHDRSMFCGIGVNKSWVMHERT